MRVTRFEDGEQFVWVFSQDTVRSIDALYEAYGPPLGEPLPEVLFSRGRWGWSCGSGSGSRWCSSWRCCLACFLESGVPGWAADGAA